MRLLHLFLQSFSIKITVRTLPPTQRARVAAVAVAMAKRVAWIGVGVMGRHMCRHLLDGGHSCSAFSRTASKCDDLVAAGATLCASPKEAAAGADIVFTMVGAPSDVESVTLGQDGVLASLRPGGVLVDMTTSTPSLAERIAEQAGAGGVLALDAPVSGGDVGAKAGSLSIMCGGSDEALTKAMPLLQLMGTPAHMGGPGAAAPDPNPRPRP